MSMRHFVSALVKHQNRHFHLNNSVTNFNILCITNSQVSNLLPRRHYSYYKSRTEESPDKYTDYEKSFAEWKYVEKLFPHTHVPQPPQDPNVELPSGWRPQNPPKDCRYLVKRTKNHQIPVYEKIMDKGAVRYTYIRRVEGNIWILEKEIGQYLQDKYPKQVIIIRTHEVHRHIIINGSFVDDVKEWLQAKGF